MPVAPPLQSPSDDLKAALDAQGEREYTQLLSMLQHTQGIFALMLVRSNFTPALRDRLLERLSADLAPAPLSIVRVTKKKYNAAQMLAEAAQFTSSTGVLVLTGLEDTPDMVVEGGKEMRRPPALSSLNHGREALRRACRLPIIVWCSDWVYETLREHAPDFFDHFTGLFQFSNTNPNSVAYNDHVMVTIRGHAESENTPLNRVSEEQLLVRAEVEFYTAEVASHPEPTPQRAEMLIGLAESLREQATGYRNALLQRGQAAATEALTILSSENESYQWARGQNALGLIYTDILADDRGENLLKAIACYEAALRVQREDTLPHEWAETLTNLGIVLQTLGDASGARKAWTNAQRGYASIGMKADAHQMQDWIDTLPKEEDIA